MVAKAVEIETFCVYCQKEYASPGRLRAHVLRLHPETYRAVAYSEKEESV